MRTTQGWGDADKQVTWLAMCAAGYYGDWFLGRSGNSGGDGDT